MRRENAMKSTVLLVVVASALVAACAPHAASVRVGDGGEASTRAKPNAEEPAVYVDTGSGAPRVLVDQEPVYARLVPGTNQRRIKFKLEQPYTFVNDGIQVCPTTSDPAKQCTSKPNPPNPCRVQGGSNRRVVHCEYADPGPNVRYFYSITVDVRGTPVTLDPSIMN
jgi:hypothetical protein